MAKKHRFKRMSRAGFSAIARRNWSPVIFAGAALPEWIHGIPEDRLVAVYGSGSYFDQRLIEADGMLFSDVVGGIYVFRYDPKDESAGFPINQDHYIVVMHPADDGLLLVAGPIEQDHKWLEKLPELIPDIVITEYEDLGGEDEG